MVVHMTKIRKVAQRPTAHHWHASDDAKGITLRDSNRMERGRSRSSDKAPLNRSLAPHVADVQDPPKPAHQSNAVVTHLLEHALYGPHWRRGLHQIAVHIQAAKVDPTTDPRLLSHERTGISELDNALFALQGPERSAQDTPALIKHPMKVRCADGRMVGLGQLVASFWLQLRNGSQGVSTLKGPTRAARRSARVRFILALAHCVAASGHRCCDAHLPERLAAAQS